MLYLAILYPRQPPAHLEMLYLEVLYLGILCLVLDTRSPGLPCRSLLERTVTHGTDTRPSALNPMR